MPETVYETVTSSPRPSRSGENTRGTTLLIAISAGFVLTVSVFGSVMVWWRFFRWSRSLYGPSGTTFPAESRPFHWRAGMRPRRK